MAKPKHELLTVDEAAAYLRVAVPTLHKWRYLRTGPPAFKIGGRLRYDEAALERWLEVQVTQESTVT